MSQPIMPGHECAICGALKREVNHWWLVFVTRVLSSVGAYAELSVTQWRADLAADKNKRPACGTNCAQKLVERWLVNSKLDSPRGAVGNPVEGHK